MRSSSTMTSSVNASSARRTSQIASGSSRPKSALSTSKIPMCFACLTSFNVIARRLRPLPICGTEHVPAGHLGVRHLSVA